MLTRKIYTYDILTVRCVIMLERLWLAMMTTNQNFMKFGLDGIKKEKYCENET